MRLIVAVLILMSLLAMPSLLADVVPRPNPPTPASQQQGSATSTVTAANGTVTATSITVPAATIPTPTPFQPLVPAYIANNQLLFRASMNYYCGSNLSGCSPSQQ